MKKSTLSVAMATYNGERFLAEQLESISSQTEPPDEIVISDDASTDRTLEIAHDFAQQTPVSVRVLRHAASQGVNQNFGAAIAHCSGDIIALSDQDDVWHPEKLAKITAAFRANRGTAIGLVFSDSAIVDAECKPLGYTLLESIKFAAREHRMFANNQQIKVLARRNVVSGMAMAFDARYKSLVLPIPAGSGWKHDWWIAFLIAASGGRIHLIEEALVDYRQHDKNDVGALRAIRKKRTISETKKTWITNVELAINFHRLSSERLKRAGMEVPVYARAYRQYLERRRRLIRDRTHYRRIALATREFAIFSYFRFYSRPVKKFLIDILPP